MITTFEHLSLFLPEDLSAMLADALANDCQSEIEERMLLAMAMHPVARTLDTAVGRPWEWPEPIPPARWLEENPYCPLLAPQFEVGSRRVDIAFLTATCEGTPLRFAIECDGHDFHEKTKEQARADKARERELLRVGFLVLRFSGSEIWRDAAACAEEAWRTIAKLAWRMD